ncbi:hypothetical protein ACNSPG_22380 (plasmid) [Brucella pituitosa]|uniref:hypothetical protein n=1 Tax=Brucella pituitosa TaxID=571256 RepID=UPI003C7671AC
MTNRITYYRIADAFGYDMIEFSMDKTLSSDRKTISLKFTSFENINIYLSVSNSYPDNNDGWGKLYTRLNGDFLQIEKFKRRDSFGDVALYIAVYENQIEELNAQFAEKLEAFNKAEAKFHEEMSDIHSKAEELYKHIETDIGLYPKTHPLSGSEKQIAWANQIREAAFISLVFDDPDNAEMRIQRTLDNPERRKAKFWIDNRKSFGY